MAIQLLSSLPSNGATGVSRSSAITFTLQTDTSTINPFSLDVTIAGIPAVRDGVQQTNFIFTFSVIDLGTTQILNAQIIVLGIFDSYQNVNVQIRAADQNTTKEQNSLSFNFTTIDTDPPLFSDITPAPNSSSNPTNTPIFFHIEDRGSGVDPSTLDITVTSTIDTGTTVIAQMLSGVPQFGFDPSNTTLQLEGTDLDVYLRLLSTTPGQDPFPSGATITVAVNISDDNNTTPLTFSFSIIDLMPPVISNLVPAPGSININENTNIAIAISDPNGDGVDLNTVNIKVNNISAVANGVPQLNFAATNIITGSNVYYFVIDPINPLPSAQPTTVYIEAKDLRGTLGTQSYSFAVRDFTAPQLEAIYPLDGSSHILPATNMTFTINEDPDGYGLDFNTLSMRVNGEIIHRQLIDGYQNTIDTIGLVDGYNIQTIPLNGAGTYAFPSIYNSQQSLLFRGYRIHIHSSTTNHYDVVIDPNIDFDNNAFIALQVNVADLGGHANSASSLFQIAALDQIVTTATPDTGTYKNFLDGYGLQNGNAFLYTTGIQLQTNLPNTRTFYTLDGTTPSIDKYGNVRGNTRFYNQPILLQREGLHVLNFFSIDDAGNQEPMKQEVYMVAPLPPSAFPVRDIPIVADITFPTRVIPVETTAVFKEGLIVNVLDNIRPPVTTKILSVNATSSPPFIIVEDPVERLSSNFTTDAGGNLILKPTPGRNARIVLIPQPIDPSSPVHFDTTAVGQNFYIGSDSSGLHQADSIIEQLRILNVASTDEEILADFTLLSKGARFTNQDNPATLTSVFSALEKRRSNLPDHTLVLLDFDGNIQSKTRQGALKNNTTTIRDKVVAGNTIVFTIYVKKNTFVDKELLRQVLRNFTPVDLQVKVNFIEID